MNRQSSRIHAAAPSPLPDPLVSVAQCNDTLLLASVIERNRAVINNGWAQLERLTQQLEVLNAREARIVQEELKAAQTIKAPSSNSAASQ